MGSARIDQRGIEAFARLLRHAPIVGVNAEACSPPACMRLPADWGMPVGAWR